MLAFSEQELSSCHGHSRPSQRAKLVRVYDGPTTGSTRRGACVLNWEGWLRYGSRTLGLEDVTPLSDMCSCGRPYLVVVCGQVSRLYLVQLVRDDTRGVIVVSGTRQCGRAYDVLRAAVRALFRTCNVPDKTNAFVFFAS